MEMDNTICSLNLCYVGEKLPKLRGSTPEVESQIPSGGLTC